MCTFYFVWPWPPFNLLPRSCLTLIFFVDSLSLIGTTLRAALSKSYAVSTNYYVCIAMPIWHRWHRCAPPILFWPWRLYNLHPRWCLTWIVFDDPHWWVPLCVQCPAKAMPFQQIVMHALQCQHDIDVHLLFCYAISTNYYACIAMPTWRICAPPILFWTWPPYNLLLRSCLTWIFYVDPHWWVSLCVQCPAKAMPFQQIIMHALQCQHDVDVHLLFCFDIDLHLTCSQVNV